MATDPKPQVYVGTVIGFEDVNELAYVRIEVDGEEHKVWVPAMGLGWRYYSEMERLGGILAIGCEVVVTL